MKIGILGGSGLYGMDGCEVLEQLQLDTPFGSPSDEYVKTSLGGAELYFLPRHGKGHTIMPAEINHRANICGFKMLGVERVISVSAVGSLREQMKPRDVVLPDQYVDRTKSSREHTFFGDGVVAHVSFADPCCADMRSSMHGVLQDASKASDSDPAIHMGGTYINMEGPAFSTRAESHANRQLGFDIIGMTGIGEARLCREAEICYQAMAMVTDFDCWHETEEPVSVETVIGHLVANTAFATSALERIIEAISKGRDCSCASALEHAIITHPDAISEEAKERLRPITGKYLS